MSAVEKSLWRTAGDGVRVRVRVTPRSARDAVEGLDETADGPALLVRVCAVPEDGAANASVETALAKWLGCARREVSLAAGHKSRVKTVVIAGDAVALEARLSRLVADLPASRTKNDKG